MRLTSFIGHTTKMCRLSGCQLGTNLRPFGNRKGSAIHRMPSASCQPTANAHCLEEGLPGPNRFRPVRLMRDHKKLAVGMFEALLLANVKRRAEQTRVWCPTDAGGAQA